MYHFVWVLVTYLLPEFKKIHMGQTGGALFQGVYELKLPSQWLWRIWNVKTYWSDLWHYFQCGFWLMVLILLFAVCKVYVMCMSAKHNNEFSCCVLLWVIQHLFLCCILFLWGRLGLQQKQRSLGHNLFAQPRESTSQLDCIVSSWKRWES